MIIDWLINHCGLQIGYVFWKVMRKTYRGYETRAKSVWETGFIQILDLPFWLKNTAEKMTSLQMCRIKKITPRTGQTFWDRQLCFYVKKLFVSEKTQKNELCHFSREIYVIKLCRGRTQTYAACGKICDINLLWRDVRSKILMISISHTLLVLLSCPLYISGVALKQIQMSF